MNTTNSCFLTITSILYEPMAKEMVNSVKKFYPDIPFVIDKREYKWEDWKVYRLQKIEDLLNIYKRVIVIDPDSVMASDCPDLFGDFDFAVPVNNINLFSDKKNRFMNDGLMVVTKKEVAKEMRERVQYDTNPYATLFAANHVFYSGKYKVEALSYRDKAYGLEELDKYTIALMNGKDINLQPKKACVMHFAGHWHKDHEKGIILYDTIFRPEVCARIKELIV